MTKKYFIAASILAILFWFFESLIHYYAFEESHFIFIPDDLNEIWMRITIVLLIILFGIYADSSTKKLLNKEKQLEAAHIYNSMVYANHHILNNLLNEFQLFKIEALRSNDFDENIITLFDDSINEAKLLIQRLSEVENITEENIWASIKPINVTSSTDKTNSGS